MPQDMEPIGGCYCNMSNSQRRGILGGVYRTLKAQNDSCVVFELTEAIGTVAAFNSEKFSKGITGGEQNTESRKTRHKRCLESCRQRSNEARLRNSEGGRDSVNLSQPRSKTRRGRVGVDMANTLDTSCNQGIFVEISPELKVYAVWYPKKQCYIAIRKLTPKECFRLQGWTDDYFEKAEFVNSNSQLYKQAGNGVTVNVIEAIARKMK